MHMCEEWIPGPFSLEKVRLSLVNPNSCIAANKVSFCHFCPMSRLSWGVTTHRETRQKAWMLLCVHWLVKWFTCTELKPLGLCKPNVLLYTALIVCLHSANEFMSSNEVVKYEPWSWLSPCRTSKLLLTSQGR